MAGAPASVTSQSKVAAQQAVFNSTVSFLE